MTGCFACQDIDTCTSCKGGYYLAVTDGCEPLNGELSAYNTDSNITITSYYVSETLLLHVVRVKGIGVSFVKTAGVDWSTEVELFIEVTPSGDVLQLVVLAVEWGSDGFSLIFYTDNPLIIDVKNMNMPFARRRRLEAQKQ